MPSPIRLVSTDFDGTLFSERMVPPVPAGLQQLLGELQRAGASWVINTGRDQQSLEETMAAAGVEARPDFLVVVEREVYVREGGRFTALNGWNARCTEEHAELFTRIHPAVPDVKRWITGSFDAFVYADQWSPLCFVAQSNPDAEAIHHYLLDYFRSVPDLTVMRNDVYARLSHVRYNKGTALAEIARHLGLTTDQIFAAGDHLNDLPMLSREFARWLVAPANAVPPVKEAIRSQGGYLSPLAAGLGVEDGLRRALASTAPA